VATGLHAWLRLRILGALDAGARQRTADSVAVLAAVTAQAGRAATPHELGNAVVAALDNALQPAVCALFGRHTLSDRFVPLAGAGRPLSCGSALAAMLAKSPAAFDCSPEPADSLVALLPRDEQTWVTDHGYRLLVPLPGPDGALPGILAIGSRRSDEPWDGQEQSLLRALASAVGASLTRLQRSSGEESVASDDRHVPAQECRDCGRVTAITSDACACGGRLHPAALPLVLSGKFAVQERLGSGGMGVVYRATDMELGRSVALKTLPKAVNGAVARMRREARAMASVQHAHLAQIFGVEDWNGTPVLVVECLEGGSLAARLAAGPLPPDRVRDIGVKLADALASMHEAGVLHRDIKPSNIGFTTAGEPKLLDFGLARLLEDVDPAESAGTTSSGADSAALSRLAGTPAYLPPEALDDAPPSPAFDLWALALVLFEALTGTNPVRGRDSADTLDRLGRVEKLGWSDAAKRAGGGARLAAHILSALDLEPRLRPGTASALRKQLTQFEDSRG
jgi:hypothetical protein